MIINQFHSIFVLKNFFFFISYCNSILQALYFCKPFRECVVNFPNGPNGLLAPLMSPTNSQTLTSSLTNGIIFKKDVNGTGEHKSKIFLLKVRF